MITSRWRLSAGVLCLVVGPLAQLAQFLVSPLRHADSASEQVAAVAAHATAMRVGLWLDLLILLLVPAVLYAGFVAGAARSRLAAAGTALVFGTSLGAGYLLAQDVVVAVAARQPDRAGAVAVVAAFSGAGVVTAVVLAYLVGHTIGFVLLGIALARSHAVPVWAGVAVAAWPLAEMAGEATQVAAVAAAGFVLLLIGFGACAAVLPRAGGVPARGPVAPAGPVDGRVEAIA